MTTGRINQITRLLNLNFDVFSRVFILDRRIAPRNAVQRKSDPRQHTLDLDSVRQSFVFRLLSTVSRTAFQRTHFPLRSYSDTHGHSPKRRRRGRARSAHGEKSPSRHKRLDCFDLRTLETPLGAKSVESPFVLFRRAGEFR